MRSLYAALVAGALGSGLWLAGAQQREQKPEEIPTISVDVEVVNLFLTVRNKQGGLVANLEKADFTVEEDGRPQTIKYFARQSDLPLTLGLLVDTSVSQGNLIEQERHASSQFFSQVLRVSKDQAFLISFDVNVDMLQDMTDSVRLLRGGLDKLRVNAGGGGGLHPGPVPTAGRPRGTLLHDAVFLASEDVLKGQAGRKGIVLITDGNDYGSQMTVQKAIEAAHKSDVIIYSILYEDRAFYYRGGFGIGGLGGDGVLKKLSEETGGRMFEVSRKKPLKAIYEQIQEELRNQYSIGYTPPPSASGNAFRRIKIKTRNSELTVQARQGYYPKSN
jgi:VWFA-related protein